MVRNKQPPQQLNEAQQQRAQWNMLDGPAEPGAAGAGAGAGPARDNHANNDAREPRWPPEPAEDEDDIQLLLNDDLIDDDDDDIDYLPRLPEAPRPPSPPWYLGARPRVPYERRFPPDFLFRPPPNQDDDDIYIIEDEVREPRRNRRVQPPKVDYGEFEEVLNNCHFYAKVLKTRGAKGKSPQKGREKAIFCDFGEITFTVQGQVTAEDIHEIPCSEFWVYVSPELDKSAVYFEWNSSEPSRKPKQKKKAASNFRHFMIEGLLDVDLWQGLSTQRYFELIFKEFDDKENKITIDVYLKNSGLIEIKFPSDTVQCNESLGKVVSYFFGVTMVSYVGEKQLKHDVEDLFDAIKACHSGKDYCSVDVQHPSLIPQLRPYQKAAVQWMLYQEKYGLSKEEKDGGRDDLHCLFTEITSRDGVVLYFNKYGGFLVKDRPKAVLPSPGGILAEEMGLGKTVEVLACMLCHPREAIPKPEYQEPIKIELQSTKRRRKVRKKFDGSDIFTLDGMCEEQDAESFTDDSLNCSSIDVDFPTEKLTRRSLSIDSTNSGYTSEKEPEMPQKHIKVHIPKSEIENKEQEDEIELNKSGRPKRRKASSGCISLDDYIVDDEEDQLAKEEDMSYQPPKKKKAVTVKKTPAYSVEQEISNCKEWSSIEAAIIKTCWDGNAKDYKKEGSHKEFRKFLKMRKKDPYYMMSVKERSEIMYKNSMAKYSASAIVSRKGLQGFFDTKVAPKSFFECICGSSEAEDRDDRFRVQCSLCSLWQHSECVQYDVTDPYRGKYVCPHCWTQEQPVLSGATLIATPSSISYQWVDEILKHLKKKAIRMLVYKGVASQGYMQPRYLASFDIVITTYETLSRELNYVDLPHSNSQLGRRFRHPKRFMATPSPLPCVEWWRVCLDEAQMVECTTTKTAEMALRLAATNRWCVTGTPIQKTVDDLQGLLMFLGVDPYWVAQWWQRCLFWPYCHDVKEPLHDLVAQYMLRHSKKDVIHQIDIPEQTEQIHWLTFNRVEEHFYQRLHAECSYEAQQKVKKFPDIKVKLSSLDRQTLASLLQPLLKLRQACNHPQVVKGQFVSLNRKTMTMEMLLDNLIKKTKLEAEEAHRLLVASMNGLAGVFVINQNWAEAVNMYRDVLRSVEEHANIKTDSLQRLHTIHNLSEILKVGHEGIQPTLRDDALDEEAANIRKRYLQKYPQQIATSVLECTQNSDYVTELESQYNSGINWWLGALQSFDDDFVLEVRDELLSSYSRFEEHKCFLYAVQKRVHLQQALNAEMGKMKQQRDDMIKGVNHLQTLDPSSFLDGAIDCHLRPTEKDPPQCLLCATHEFFEDYEETIFSMKELKHTRTTGVSKETEDIKERADVKQATRRGNWGQNETERVLRYLQTKSLGKVDEEIYEDSQLHLKVLDAMKKEFKNYRILWRAVFDWVSAMDEVNMATIRLRLRFPDEEVPQPKKKKNEAELEKKMEVLRYVIEPCELPQREMQLKSERIVAANDLRIKLGQLLYLQNLAKTDFGKGGGKNPEPCPICQNDLGERWAVLLCGHCYCMECMRTLSNRGFNGMDKSNVKCPMCRQPTRTREICYVDTRVKEEEEVVKVQGSLSTKMEGVVKLMLRINQADPEAKVLIFSSWGDVLDVVGDAFAQNGITYRALHKHNKFQKHLASFKNNKQITALLVPITSGANGINIIEARHVILIEPILNPAAELQAIGRVHRIGQTKATVVHRFVIRGTIEERMHYILRHYHDSLHTDENTVTIEDFKNLFIHPEELELQKEIAKVMSSKVKGNSQNESHSICGEGSSTTTSEGSSQPSTSRFFLPQSHVEQLNPIKSSCIKSVSHQSSGDVSVAQTSTSETSVSHPSTNEPSVSHPSTSDPSVSSPPTRELSVSHPSASDPSVSHSSNREPSVSHPSTTDPLISSPPTRELSVSHPSGSDPSVSSPSTRELSVSHPSASDPSVSHSSIRETSFSHPLTIDPSVSNPSTIEHSTSHPSSTHQLSILHPSVNDDLISHPSTSEQSASLTSEYSILYPSTS